MKSNFEFDPITYEIIGAAIEVHNELGPGLPEEFYQKALEHELTIRKINFEAQKQVLIDYKNATVGICYLDLFVENRVVVELKSVHKLDNVHMFQVIKYLIATNCDTALLVNFGAVKLEYKRIIPPSKIQDRKCK